MRILFRLELRFIDSHQLLPAARVFAKAVVGNAVKPGREPRFAAEAADVFVGLEKRFLRQVIRERRIGPSELPEQTSHRGLMPPHEFGEGVMIVIEKDSGDEVCIRQRHSRTL